MKKIISFYNNLSIAVKFTLIIVLAFILLTGSILFSANLYTRERLDTYFAVHTSSNEQLLDKLDGYVADIANVTKIPLTYKLNDSAYMSLLSEFDASGDNSYEFQRQNEQIFEQIMTYKNEVNSCYIFNNAGDGDYKVKYAIYSPFDPTGEAWFARAVEKFGKPVFVPTYELPNIVNDNLKPVYVFGIARGIVQLKTGSVIGILLVNTEVTYLGDLCREVNLSPNHRILIMNGNYCLFDSKGEFTATGLGDSFGDAAGAIATAISTSEDAGAIAAIPENTPDRFYKCHVGKQECYATSLSSDMYGLRVVSIAPADELLGGLTRIQFVNFLQLILIITAVLLVMLFAIRQVVAPITLLSSMMKMAEDGDFTNHVKLQSGDEVGNLARSYNSLIDRINSLIKEVYIEKINANELELQMLQSQINPHFLYNTLESISMMATINDDDITADMAASLGSILRYSISDLNKPVSLGDEVNHVKQYFELQEYRFKNRYRLEIDIEPALYSLQTPKLMLQPVVENAIYHGMQTVRSGGLIRITGERLRRGLYEIRVADNGAGMPQEQLDRLNDYINEKNEMYDSIGLRNVNRRIKLFCGQEAGLRVESVAGGGTSVASEREADSTVGCGIVSTSDGGTSVASGCIVTITLRYDE